MIEENKQLFFDVFNQFNMLNAEDDSGAAPSLNQILILNRLASGLGIPVQNWPTIVRGMMLIDRKKK